MWHYQGHPFTDAPTDHYGFVYEITCIPTGRRYIGRKCFWNRISKPPLRGKKRRRRSVKPSDWRSYFGSCEELLSDVQRMGPEAFRRTIVKLCRTKGELSYAEVEAQVKADVLSARLETGEWAFYNGNIMNRFYRR